MPSIESDTHGQRFVTTWPCIVEASYLLATTQRLEAHLAMIRTPQSCLFRYPNWRTSSQAPQARASTMTSMPSRRLVCARP